MKKKALAVCSPNHYGTSNATKEECAECGKELYLSESTLLAAKERDPSTKKEDLHILCMNCALPFIQKLGSQVIPPSELQKEQVAKVMVERIDSKNRINP